MNDDGGLSKNIRKDRIENGFKSIRVVLGIPKHKNSLIFGTCQTRKKNPTGAIHL